MDRRSALQMVALLPAAPWVLPARPGTSASPADFILDHACNELARCYTDVQAHGPRGEQFRTAAATLRLLHAYSERTGIGRRFDAQLAAITPDALTAFAFDEEGFRAAARARGVTVEHPLVTLSPEDRAGRGRMLARHPGLNRMLLDHAHGLEVIGRQVDKRGLVALASLRQDEVWLCLGCAEEVKSGPASEACTAWWAMVLMLEATSLAFAMANDVAELAWFFGLDALWTKVVAFAVAGCTI